MKTRGSRGLIVLLVLASAINTVAMDIGLPGPLPGGGKLSLELFYEDFERDIRQEAAEFWAPGSPHGGLVGEDMIQEETRYFARLTYAWRRELALQALVGFTHSETADNDSPVLGLGLQYLVWSCHGFDTTLFAAGQLVNEIRYKNDFYYGPNPPNAGNWEWPEGTQKEDYYELSAGATVSRDIQLHPRLTMRPYAGLQLSKLDGDEKYDHTWAVVEPLGREVQEGYIKDDGVLALFGGAGLFWDNRFGLRLEGRFVNQTSFSAGLFYFF